MENPSGAKHCLLVGVITDTPGAEGKRCPFRFRAGLQPEFLIEEGVP